MIEGNGTNFEYSPQPGQFFQAKIDPLLVSPPVVDTTIGPPGNNNGGIVGTIPGSFSVSQSGAATYNVPLTFPAGTNGLAPSLSLKYSSQGGDGIICEGWTLQGLSVISRYPYTYYFNDSTHTVVFTNEDELVFNGKHLIKINENEYRTENESFTKVVPIDGNINNGFVVYQSNGMVSKYGSGDNSRQFMQDCPAPITWYVDTIFDASKNYLAFEYYNNPDYGCIYPNHISYTGNTNTSVVSYYRIDFLYEDNLDTPKMYFYNDNPLYHGIFSKVIKRLTSIQCYYLPTTEKITEYILNYEQQGLFNKHFLTSVTNYGSDENYFNPTLFEWNNAGYSPGLLNNSFGLTEDAEETTALFGSDFNQDGKDDLIHFKTNPDNEKQTFFIHMNSSSGGVFSPTAEFTHEFYYPVTFFQTGDFNGDGINDIFYVYLYGNYIKSKIMYMNYNESSNSFTYTTSNDLFSLSTSVFVHPTFVISDFTGDGIMDCCVLYEPSGSPIFTELKYYLSTSENPLSIQVTDGSNLSYKPKSFFARDYNGDHKSELLIISENDSRIYYLSLNNQIINYYSGPAVFASTTGNIVSGDFNKDGKTDVLLLTVDQDNNVKLYNSYGEGFVAAPPLTISNIISGVSRPLTIDLNGDSYDDLSVIKILWGSGNEPNKFIRVDYLTNPDGKSFTPGDTLILQNNAATTTGYTNINLLRYMWGEFHNSCMSDMVTIHIDTAASSKYRVFCDIDSKNISTVSKITNGFGEELSIRYIQNDVSLSYAKGADEEYPICYINGGLQIVQEYEMETGENSLTYLVRLKYKGAKYHKCGKGFLGFDEFTLQNDANGKSTTTYYSHDNPYFNVQTDSIKQWITSSSKLISREIFTNNYHDYGGKRFFNYVNENSKENFNLSSELTDFYLEDLTYFLNNDGIPDRIEKNSKKEFGEEWVNKFSEISLLNLTTGSKWIIGLQDSILTIHTAYDEVPINRMTVKEYDNQTGQLINNIIEPANTNNFETAYAYDDYGNVIETTLHAAGMNDRTNTATFIQNGRLFATSANAMGHETEYQYYTITGNLRKTTDVNGLETSNFYDGFGRNIKTIAPDGKETHNVLLWAQGHPDAPIGSCYYSWSRTSGQPEKLVFFDKYSRELRGVSVAFDGRKIYTDQEYHTSGNKIGLIKKVSNPYYLDSIPYYETYTYDDLGRKLTITSPDGITKTFSYGIKEVTTTIEAGTETRIKINKLDAAGRLINSQDVTNNQSVYNNYYSNGLIKETWVANCNQTKISYFYDIFGNLDSIIDPNRGTMTKTYNAFGEITSEMDANGNNTIFTYDLLGRVTNRIESDGITNWYYDTQNNGVGKIHYVTFTFTDENNDITNSKEEFFYDELGREIKSEQTVDGAVMVLQNSYDVYSRIKSITYPSGYVLKNYYNENGYLIKVSDDNSGILWEANVVNSVGKIQEFTLGQNIHSNRTYQSDNFRLLSIRSGKNSNTDLQNLGYEWDEIGNLEFRRDYNKGLSDNFIYDNFDRLLQSKINGNLQLQQYYTNTGNISSKSNVGNYQYSQNNAGPNAVTSIQNPVSPLLNSDQQIYYTSFDKIVKIIQGDSILYMAYGQGHNRIKQKIDHGDGNVTTKTFFGSLYEKIEFSDGTSKELHYLSSPGGIFGVLTIDNLGNKTLNYLLKDHLGSINLVLDKSGDIVEELNFDAWGRLRNPNNWMYDNTIEMELFDRGFTMHEHLREFNLINMNGRVYDTVLARFLSPDPLIQDPENTQNHNGYSYVLNNPLKYTDPTGYSFIDALDAGFRTFLNIVTVPARILSAGNEWLNDQINGSPDPNGYFSLEYIVFSKLPAPDAGFYNLFGSNSLSIASYGAGGGFVAADGNFYSNDEMAGEAWAIYTANHQAVEEGDFNNMDVLASLDLGNMHTRPGMSFVTPIKDGEETTEEKKAAGQGGGVLNGIQTGLDVLGLIPGVGEFFDGANALIYTARGDYVNAGLSAAACIPFAGWAATGGKLANKAYTVYQGVDKATGAVKYVGITSREVTQRAAEHMAKGDAWKALDYRAVPGALNLDRTGARVMEQNLINQYGLPNLYNQINSISPQYWSIYGIK